jgi:hypothetical protein
VGLCVFIPLISVSVYQLSGSGKMDRGAVYSFSGLCLVIGLVNVVILGSHYSRVLRPRRARLEQILAGMRDEAH